MRIENLRQMQCSECGETSCSDALILSPRCHLRGAVAVAIDGTTIEIYCFECAKLVVNLETPGFSVEGSECKCGAGYVVAYHKSHLLTLQCQKCKNVEAIVFPGDTV